MLALLRHILEVLKPVVALVRSLPTLAVVEEVAAVEHVHRLVALLRDLSTWAVQLPVEEAAVSRASTWGSDVRRGQKMEKSRRSVV